MEVKKRADFAGAAEAVTAAGRRRIVRAAALWLAAHPSVAGFDLRFDVVLTIPRHLPRHIPGAFDAGDLA